MKWIRIKSVELMKKTWNFGAKFWREIFHFLFRDKAYKIMENLKKW